MSWTLIEGEPRACFSNRARPGFSSYLDARSNAGTCNAADSPTVLLESAGRTTEVVREADADKARAGALGGPKATVRSTIRGTSDDQTRKARDPVTLGISRLPIPRLGVPAAWGGRGVSLGGYPQSLPVVKRTLRAARG
jgi:hypothetical protein